MLYYSRKYPNRIAAAVIWVLALGTTYTAIRGFDVPVLMAGWLTLLIQGLLTYLEHFLWTGGAGEMSSLSYIALLLDGFINFGGAWAIASRLHQTGSYQGLSAAFGFDGTAVPGLVAFVLAVALSLLLCVAPEKLWSMEQPRSRVKPPKGYQMDKPTDWYVSPTKEGRA